MNVNELLRNVNRSYVLTEEHRQEASGLLPAEDTAEAWTAYQQYELPDAIADSASRSWGIFARCYFSILMFFGGIIGISLIDSIFVDSMTEDNNGEVLERLKHIEDKLDKMK